MIFNAFSSQWRTRYHFLFWLCIAYDVTVIVQKAICHCSRGRKESMLGMWFIISHVRYHVYNKQKYISTTKTEVWKLIFRNSKEAVTDLRLRECSSLWPVWAELGEEGGGRREFWWVKRVLIYNASYIFFWTRDKKRYKIVFVVRSYRINHCCDNIYSPFRRNGKSQENICYSQNPRPVQTFLACWNITQHVDTVWTQCWTDIEML